MTVDVSVVLTVACSVAALLVSLGTIHERHSRPQEQRDREEAEYRKDMDRRIANLEGRMLDVEAVAEVQGRDLDRQSKMLEATLEGVVTLTRHEIDGNHQQQLKAYADKMDAMLIKRG